MAIEISINTPAPQQEGLSVMNGRLMIYEYAIIQRSNINVGSVEHIEYPEQRESFLRGHWRPLLRPDPGCVSIIHLRPFPR
jgi:hypothetical protein